MTERENWAREHGKTVAEEQLIRDAFAFADAHPMAEGQAWDCGCTMEERRGRAMTECDHLASAIGQIKLRNPYNHDQAIAEYVLQEYAPKTDEPSQQASTIDWVNSARTLLRTMKANPNIRVHACLAEIEAMLAAEPPRHRPAHRSRA